ncbi:DUF1365 domain-containing protein [Elstera litoralis]|nr:DUF1365 domain-containing protein [Elstera litoralis]
MLETCFYRGTVAHTRLVPFRHHFAYRVFSALFDLDTLPQQSRKTKLFSHNRWNILSFFDRDHGARDGSSPRAWIDGILRTNGYAPEGWKVWLHCFPRLFGYVFNPLSIYFCCDAAGVLRVILYDVRNTFGDKHGYLIPVETPAGPIQQTCAKGFHVSPFFPVEGRYRFDLMPPGDRLTARIGLEVEGKPQFFRHTNRRAPPVYRPGDHQTGGPPSADDTESNRGYSLGSPGDLAKRCPFSWASKPARNRGNGDCRHRSAFETIRSSTGFSRVSAS